MLEIVPDIAQGTHGNRNIFADIRNVPTRPHTVLGMFLLPFSVTSELLKFGFFEKNAMLKQIVLVPLVSVHWHQKVGNQNMSLTIF